MLAISFVLFCMVVGLAIQVGRQETRIRQLEEKLSAGASPTRAPLTGLPDSLPDRPLHGTRVVLEIEQDHERPIFARLLHERLLEEDATPVIGPVIEPNQPLGFQAIVIHGRIRCNGYEENYFEALLDCSGPEGVLLTVSERPPQGARQANLANTLVSRLKQEVLTSRERRERQFAIDELGSGL